MRFLSTASGAAIPIDRRLVHLTLGLFLLQLPAIGTPVATTTGASVYLSPCASLSCTVEPAKFAQDAERVPAGYPESILLAFVSPWWFARMGACVSVWAVHDLHRVNLNGEADGALRSADMIADD